MENKKIINLCLAHMSDEGWEEKFVKEAFETNWVVPLGPNVNAFEKDLEAFVGEGRKVVALSAGTAAVHLGLLLSGVEPGDEVIVQSCTFCASANPVKYIGARPVFVDSEEGSWNMDPELLEKAILDRIAVTGRKPKAIVPVALYGMPYNVDAIMDIAGKYDIPVVEDAAEGFGSRWRGRILGTFGQFGVMSFNGNKMITTSGGGALICPSAEAKAKALFFATQAREQMPFYQHEEIGFNYRLSNVCAGIGRGQMMVANDHIAHHKHVHERYVELLKDVPGIEVHSSPGEDYDSNYWLSTITIDPSVKVKPHAQTSDATKESVRPNDNVENLREWLADAGIESRPIWKPMHLQPVYADSPAYVNGVSEKVFRTGLCLPSGPLVSDADLDFIVGTILSFIEA